MIKNICFYGVGGIGGYFGAQFIEHNINNDLKISFVARGKHLEEIKNNGLLLKTDNEQIIVKPNYISKYLDKNEKFDLIIISVKSYDLDQAIENIKESVTDNTIILPLLNGVDIYQRVRKILKNAVVLPACVYVGTQIEKPGVILQKGAAGKIIFGKDLQRNDFNLDNIITLFEDMNITYIYEENAYKQIWTKYMFVCAYALVTANSGKSMAQVYEDTHLRNDTQAIMSEIKAIADKKNIPLDDDVVSKSLVKANAFPYSTKTSYQRDIESHKQKNEGDIFGAAVIKMGKEYSVNVSITSRYYKEE